jgi:hypothetical protein
MQTVSEAATYSAPIETVFDWLTTASNYGKARRMISGRLLRPGRDGGEGLGAHRAFRSTVSWWQEEISAYERPQRFGYQVIRTFPPVYRHHGARIELSEREGRTHVTWVSSYSIPVPRIGPAIERAIFPIGRFYVRSILDAAKDALAA